MESLKRHLKLWHRRRNRRRRNHPQFHSNPHFHHLGLVYLSEGILLSPVIKLALLMWPSNVLKILSMLEPTFRNWSELLMLTIVKIVLTCLPSYLDSIPPSTSQLTEVEESSEDEARAHAQRMRDQALEQPLGSLIRTLSEHACDQTPVVPINQEDWSHSDYVTDESIEEKNGEKNGEQC